MYDNVCGLSVRPQNVFDHNIVINVIQNNRYRLPQQFSPRDVVIDIGAHVGSFSYACLIRGVGKVHAFEPDRGNLRLCTANLKQFKRKVTLNHAAVWRSDTYERELMYTGCVPTADGVNYGGGNVVFEDGRRIPTRCESLDSILSNIRHVRLMKLDCESGEWPILFTSRLLECVEEIIGEYHEIGGKNNQATIPPRAGLPGFTSYTRDALNSFLKRHGFSVEIDGKSDSNIGLFFAKR